MASFIKIWTRNFSKGIPPSKEGLSPFAQMLKNMPTGKNPIKTEIKEEEKTLNNEQFAKDDSPIREALRDGLELHKGFYESKFEHPEVLAMQELKAKLQSRDPIVSELVAARKASRTTTSAMVNGTIFKS